MIELYQHEYCSGCSRVRRKLTDLGLDWISRTVDPDHRNRQKVIDLVGQPSVPVLVDVEHRMIVTEAHDICAYLDETYGPGATGEP
ncbi:MAG TPA: glutathione S-transferase N-terminal domain-containing protein, partial [Candidatus Saccharimonadales bacterium]|nr:glutathione S-transferase N-terminal domain-containing protein [Candidatus Saccharimonadales bacterium]